MKTHAHVMFDGECEAAFRLYEKCLGGNLFMLTWADSPMAHQAPPGWGEKILHATLTIGSDVLTGADPPPGLYKRPAGFALQIDLKEAIEAERIFDTLAEGGTVDFSLQETFWAFRYGCLVDRFGIPWEINCAHPE